jgi:nucleoside-diphosphate-sugar epimerase
MKILITGSNGFIGKNLVKHLMGEVMELLSMNGLKM